jgi:hypothetical protein
MKLAVHGYSVLQVTITDIGKVLPLIEANVRRNGVARDQK